MIYLAAAVVCVPLADAPRPRLGARLPGRRLRDRPVGSAAWSSDVECDPALRRVRRGADAVRDRARARAAAPLDDARGGVRRRRAAARALRRGARRRARSPLGLPLAGGARRRAGARAVVDGDRDADDGRAQPARRRRSAAAAFAVLLFQDIAAIPLLAVVPLLAAHATPTRRIRGCGAGKVARARSSRWSSSGAS